RKQQHQQQLFNTNLSSIYSLVPTAPATATTQAPSISNKLSLVENTAHVLKLIHKWCSDNKENFHLEHFDLQENFDFFLNIDYDESSDVAKELTLSRQQQQQSTPVTLTSSNRSNTSSIEVAAVSPTNAQTTTQMDSSALPNETVHNGGKRRLISQ
ncbi:unnamed protein product, partial [Rotaria sp. Silwood1]